MLGSLPENPMIALSGGVDSMVVADFISRTREVTCLFFHHKTETSEKAHSFLVDYCKSRDWYLIVKYLSEEKPKHESYEEFWRNQRYSWFDSFSRTVVTGHHLDDCVETYLWSTMHGTPKTIPYQRNNVVRPFLLTPKQAMYDWAKRHSIPWIEDETNKDTSYMRNFVRHELLPKALHVNPGLQKVVARKVKACYNAALN
jgi:tRNA(Ile)-lysidine synthase